MSKRDEIIEVIAMNTDPLAFECWVDGSFEGEYKYPAQQVVAMENASGALKALEEFGYIVRPRDATEGMIDKGWRKFDKYAKPQNRCCNMDRAMTNAWEKEMNE